MKTCMRYIAVVFAVAMIVCAISSVSAAYPDVDSKSTYASAIETMTNLGILGGYEDGTFRPDNLVRRDEMAKIVYVAYTTYKDAGEGTIIFPDVPANSWAKGYISWCASKDIVGGYEDGTFRPEGNITYNEALKMVCAMLGYTDFRADLWPQDVITKALIDLELGDKLAGIEGNTALTRAQVVQLVFNALDKPMYQKPKAEEDMSLTDQIMSSMGNTVLEEKSTLRENVWKIEIIDAQIIATENYGLFDYENKIHTAKTEKKDEIVVRLTSKKGVYEDKRLKLSDVSLDAYEGKTDELLTLKIAIVRELGKSDSFISASLIGKRKDGVVSAYAAVADLADDEIYLESGYLKRAKYGLSIDGIDHYNDEYKAIRRLTYFDDMVVVTNAHVDSAGTVIDAHTAVSSAGAGYSRWRENLASSLGKTHYKYNIAIDSDSDGWYDYVVMEYEELFKVTAATSKSVTFEYYYKASQDSKWVPVPDYKMPGTEDIDATGAPVAGTEKVLSTDLTFSLDKVNTVDALKVGDIIQGYQLGDTFTVTKQSTTTKTAYITKYAPNQDSPQNTAMTLSDGSKISLAYGTSLWASSNYNTNQVKGVLDKLEPRIGINTKTNNYNYVKFTLIDDRAIFAEEVKAELAAVGDSGYNKAILLYVTEATEPQINEETKEYEVFYPAYLLVDGRTYLVNLKPSNAINGFTGETVASEGSEFRASLEEDNGVQRIMYANKLVTYTVDGEGYFTLSTTNKDFENVNDANMPLEVVIPAAADNKISVDENTGIFTISNDRGVIRAKIMKNADSIIYYPDTNPKLTGKHEFLEYLKGDEIPTDFEPTEVRSDIYLTLNEDKGIYYIAALVLNEKFEGSTVESDYNTDARQHLYAVRNVEAVAEGTGIFAAYTFKKIDTLETVEAVNTKAEYDESKNVNIKNKIMAWDADAKDYVEVVPSDECKSLLDAEVISDIMADEQILFTTSYVNGIKIDESVNIVALVDKETAELKTIEFSELVDVFDTIKNYNEINSTTEKLTARIGTYVENDRTKIAYIIIDWVEYNEDLEKLVFAGDDGINE